MADGSKLTHIVLVHGAAHGGWCWEALVPLLKMKGFEVSAPDLPGLGDDRTPLPEVTLQSYIDRVVDSVERSSSPVMLVGHSMGGMPISGAGEAIPEKIGKLIYLTAIMPVDGEAMFSDRLTKTEVVTRSRRPSAIEGAHDFDLSLAPEIFYNCCPPEIAVRAAARLRSQPDAPLLEPVSLTEARWGNIPKTYILCTKDRVLPPEHQHWLCDRAPGVKKRFIDADHSPFFSDPVGLAKIIEEEARL